MDKLGDDLLIGAKAIARFVFLKDDKKHQRKVYHVKENVKEKWPIFTIGPNLAARKSSLKRFIEDKERKAITDIAADSAA